MTGMNIIKTLFMSFLLLLGVFTSKVYSQEDIFNLIEMEQYTEESKSLLHHAHEAYQKNKLKKAVQIINSVLETEEHTAPLHKLQAEIYLEMGNTPAAMSEYHKAILKDKDNYVIYQALINIYLKEKQFDQAVDILKTYLQDHPEDYKAIFNVANLLGLKGDYKNAIEYLEGLLAIHPNDSKILKNIALSYKLDNNNAKAIEYYNRTLEKKKDPEIYNELGLLYIESQDYNKAQEYFNKAIELEPKNLDFLYNNALLNIERNSDTDAYNTLNQMLNIDSMNSKALAMLIYLSGKKQKASIKNIVTTDNDLEAYMNIESGYKKPIQYEVIDVDALLYPKNTLDTDVEMKDLEQTALKKPDNSDQIDEANQIKDEHDQQTEQSTGEKEQAKKDIDKDASKLVLYQKLSVLHPENKEVLYKLAFNYLKNKNFSEAEQTLIKLIKIDEDYKDALELLGVVSVNLNNMEKARAIYLKLAEKGKSVPDIHNQMGFIYYSLNEYDKAIDELKTSLLEYPDDIMTHFLLSLIYEKQEKYAEEIHQLQKILELEPENTEALKGMVYTLTRLKRYNQAKNYLEKLVALHAENKEYYFHLAQLYIKLIQYDDAIKTLQSLLDKYPDEAEAHYLLANLYAKNSKLPEAITHFEEAIRNNPENPVYHYELALAYYENNQIEQSKKVMEKLKSLDSAFYTELSKIIVTNE
jgi:tetratricopeptide (TPR) repeat protein